MTTPLSTGRVVVKATRDTIGTVVHVCRHDELVTIWMHYVSERFDPGSDEDYPLIPPVIGQNRNDKTWSTVRVTVEPSQTSLLCHAFTTGGFGKYMLVEDLFLKRGEQIRIACDESVSGRILVTGYTSRMEPAPP